MSLVNALQAAHEVYTPVTDHGNPTQCCVLMLVQPLNFNIADERPIEYGLWDKDIPCYRCEWQDVLERTTLNADRMLTYRLVGAAEVEWEVSVVYYRGGYDAAEYREQSRETRLRLEMSRAIKCPDVLTHLAGMKAVQQALGEIGVLERFLDEEKAARVRSTFMPMYKLDASDAGQRARKVATDPEQAKHYVLKPNLEGGGNNVYGSGIPDFLASVPKDQWHKYILMRLIEPPADIDGVLMTAERLHQGPVVSELGLLGTVLWRRRKENGGMEMIRNEAGGWTFKTKPTHVEEMSVVKGFGCFDCPRLTD